jgi:hypothetical protein
MRVISAKICQSRQGEQRTKIDATGVHSEANRPIPAIMGSLAGACHCNISYQSIKTFVHGMSSVAAKPVNIMIFWNALATLTFKPNRNTSAAHFPLRVTASSNCHEPETVITFAALPYFLP